ncbi:MAG TPA: TonB family protein [Terriglobales bacterium]|nr:TonB family protein [Terriglobales bacterium]
MSYKALLFCPDEKTARTVTQVLSELDFEVETSIEPFATVKRLTAEHFDAVVVDCENEQNATLLFKSARNSGLNQASLSIAVVEGQAGVAKAFRIGANLVLTKPINVEQSKGTIRVARGLLRKSESARPTAPVAKAEQPTPSFINTPRAPLSPTPAPGLPTSFELENEPEAQPEPTEAAFLESMPDPAAGMERVQATAQNTKASPWQPIPKPTAATLQTAADATGRTESSALPEISLNPPFTMSASSAAAAAAPARQKPRQERESDEIGLPSFAVSTDKPKRERSYESGGTKKVVLIAAVLLLAAGLGYVALQKSHYIFTTSRAPKPAPNRQTVQPPGPVAPMVPTSEQVVTPEQIPEESAPAPMVEKPETPPPAHETATPKAKKAASRIASSEPTASSADDDTDENAPEAIVVKSANSKPAPAPQPAADQPAPAALDLAPGSANDAISGLVSVSPTVPRQAPATVSQGISQGLLVKKVAPVYPQQALQMKVQGAVQILATISKDGNITNMKLLSGDAILGRAAMDAVKQWKYKPYYLDSQPVEIQTQITVNFKLP